MELRPYQRECVDAMFRYFYENSGNPIGCVPVGGGKTPIMATFMREAITSWPGTRILLLSHVKELLQQTAGTLRRVWPSAPLSIYSAGLKSKDLRGQIVVAGVQSIYKKAYDLQQVDLVLIDECHLLGNSDSGMYRRLLADLAIINGGRVPVIGFSATPWRESGGLLHRSENALFTDVAYEIGMADLIEQGWLCPLRCKNTETALDVSGVHTRQGDYVAAELQAAVDRADINEAIVDELIRKGHDRKAWLLFASGIEHGRHLCDLIRARGIDAACVFGETPSDERDATVSAFRAGRLRCLVNVAALLIGFDAPHVDLIGVARPTKSKGRYIQMLGRGTRLAEEKKDCLVLDWAGVVAQHGPVDLVRGTERRKGAADEPATPPTKVCPECEERVYAGVRACPACGHEWPAPDLAEKLHGRAVESAVLACELTVSDWLPVSRVEYREHRKPGGLPTLRCDYRCGLATFSEWICLDHEGFPREKAERWWKARALTVSSVPPVSYAVQCAAKALKTPTAIRVRPDGKWHRIVGTKFT